jgi:hypothetical protein
MGLLLIVAYAIVVAVVGVVILFLIGLADHYVSVAKRVEQAVTNLRQEQNDASKAGENKKSRGFSMKKIEGVKFDFVVIGSGIGGLASASLLARRGHKVRAAPLPVWCQSLKPLRSRPCSSAPSHNDIIVHKAVSRAACGCVRRCL